MSDFSDRPFVAGSMTGIRSWIVDRYGRLRATQVNVVWTPGENVGRCMKEQVGSGGLFAPLLKTMTLTFTPDPRSYGGQITASGAVAEEFRPECDVHKVGSLTCTCGFYAYFDNGPNGYHQDGNLLGLIEGYGVTTVGNRGFRSEKARVKALIVDPEKRTGLVDRVLVNYPAVPVFERKSDALAEFPLTPPPIPTPDEDPEFWTKEAL